MANKRFFAGILVMALVFGMAFVGCSGDDGSTGGDSVEYTSKDSGGNTYKLTITKNTNKAAYTPASGDNYKLTITYAKGPTKTSTGTIASYTSTVITLESAKGGTFTVTITTSGTMTKIEGTITLDDGTTAGAPGALTPQVNNPGGGTDPALNGTWVAVPVAGETYELKLDKGNYEISFGGSPSNKGTYTTKDGNLTITMTHLWGETLNYGNDRYEAKWCTRAELKAAGASDADLNGMFETYTWPYSVNGNKLTLGSGNDQETYTKKQ
jgi:hypothetical protein